MRQPGKKNAREQQQDVPPPAAFDPSVNYFAKIDQLMPKWHRAPSLRPDAHVLSDDQYQGARNITTSSGASFTMPFQKYVRAIDPVGNMTALTIATSRVPEDDNTGYADRAVSIKRRKGWLIAEEAEYWQGPHYGQEHAYHCLVEMERRKALHAGNESEAAKAFQSRLERDTRENNERVANAIEMQAQKSTEMVEALATKLASAISGILSNTTTK